MKGSMSQDHISSLQSSSSQARLPGGISYSPAPKKNNRMQQLQHNAI